MGCGTVRVPETVTPAAAGSSSGGDEPVSLGGSDRGQRIHSWGSDEKQESRIIMLCTEYLGKQLDP